MYSQDDDAKDDEPHGLHAGQYPGIDAELLLDILCITFISFSTRVHTCRKSCFWQSLSHQQSQIRGDLQDILDQNIFSLIF